MTTKVVPFYPCKYRHYNYDYRSSDSKYVVKEYSSRSKTSATAVASATTAATAIRSTTAASATRSTTAASATRSTTAASATRSTTASRSTTSATAASATTAATAFTATAASTAASSSTVATAHEEESLEYSYKVRKRINEVVKTKVSEKYIREESRIRGPEFLVRLRSHTVFENTSVKLFCTVHGYPTPYVKWFKDNVLIDTASTAAKYFVESNYGVHSLEITRCSTDDTALYTAVATNLHGQASSQAAVIVKRFRGEEESCPFAWLPYQFSMLPEITYTKIDITFLETFDVTFGTEGDTVTLVCKMDINPYLANLQPDAVWFRDEHLLKESKWAKIEAGGGVVKLTLPQLYKDDEGLYTLRMVTKGGSAVHSAYVFVTDGPPPVPKAPGAPMDIKIHDANRDYVIVSWKPPNTTTEGPIIGYFVDKCEVGTDNWVQCNDSPIKICKYPVASLFEGHSYYIRVRAVNAHGISRPSRMSDAIAAVDPTEFERLQAMKLGGKLDVVTYHDDLEAEGSPPGAPANVHASETDRTYVVLSWEPPAYRGRAPMWYYIEKSLADSGTWQRVNTQVPVRSPRYAVFDLAEGKLYSFRVLSANMYGLSESSPPSPAVQTQELKGVPSAPGQVVATRNTKTSVLVQWDPPKHPNNLIGYYIDCCVKGSKDWVSCNHKPHKHTRFVVHGLTTGETYAFRVQAINELGLSDESQESAPLSVQAALKVPSSPYDIALLLCDGNSMIINWKPPKHSGGAKVTDYYVDKREVSHHTWRETNIPPIKERIFKVENQKSGAVYEFQVYAASFVGVGNPSEPSSPFVCQAWTMPEPGPPYDLTCCEIRNDSVVVEWKAPLYAGSSEVTGYTVEMSKKGSDTWTTANETAVSHRYLKVTQLEEGESYVFRVHAQNDGGVGKASMASDPVVAKALEGIQEVQCGVDAETGDIYLSFESCEMSENSSFVWKKSYEEITDFSKGIAIKTEGSRSKLIFKNPDKDDVGTFSVAVTHTNNVSSSYVLAPEELEKMLAQSYDIRHPIIPLKSELSYKILERGRMRFWVQAESISSAVTYKFFKNDKEFVNSEQYKMSHDVATGIIEMVQDHFTEDSEGTYTVQIQDGKGKNQSSLVLIGDAFKAALAEAEFQRREYIRVKEGPHFSEFLSVHVGDDCSVTLLCKVANLKKESVFHWYKEAVEVEALVDLTSGVCKLPLPLFSKKDQGVYRATISDDRGKDESQINISGQVFDDIVIEITHLAGVSAGDLVIHCTAEGIRLQCQMKYYLEEMNINWSLKAKKLSASEHLRIGGTPQMATLEIVEPTDKDKGTYTIEIVDVEKSHTRTVDLSGKAYDDAYVEFQRLKAEAYAEKNRGQMVGGLPDVVTIMEHKTLSLTCTVCGDPKPQACWFRNDQEVDPDDHFIISMDSSKFATLTIKGVSMEDSGKYTMSVQNKYGGEAVDVTVAVYKHGDKIPEVKPVPAPKRITPPKLPIIIPTAATKAPPTPPATKAPSPAPAGKSTAARGIKSPVPGRKK
ncbi:myomesin-2 [Anguilla anguilla]|uniref:myomesin-2 n=1 Tax=Anguilla anguilla TaxID=7936 RepID=UPI0015B37B0E|nr:myomesin-2 [Anguilla anguilla]XP_035256171.1 myomesin-2 [Anguilla anguilla]